MTHCGFTPTIRSATNKDSSMEMLKAFWETKKSLTDTAGGGVSAAVKLIT